MNHASVIRRKKALIVEAVSIALDRRVHVNESKRVGWFREDLDFIDLLRDITSDLGQRFRSKK